MYVLSLTERACCSDLKTKNMCSNCKRNISLSDAHLYEHWTEPILTKSFKNGVSIKCSSFLKA